MKIKIFLIIIVSFFLGKDIFAQSSGTNPYVGSNHVYYVNTVNEDGVTHDPDHDLNTYYWYLTDESDVAVTGTDIFTAGQAWGTDASPLANLFSVGITWGANAVGNTYRLYVKEYSGSGCISTRKITITVKASAFDITMVTADASCSAASGTLLAGSSPTLPSSTRTFTVSMTGSNNSWEFEPTITVTNGTKGAVTYKYDSNDDGAYNEELTITGGVITVPAGETSIEISVVVTTLWNSNSTAILAQLDAGSDVLYGTTDIDEVNPGDFAASATSTINPLPLTTEISTN